MCLLLHTSCQNSNLKISCAFGIVDTRIGKLKCSRKFEKIFGTKVMNFLRCMAILDWCGLSLHHNRRKICCSVCRSQVIIIIFNGIFLTIFIFWICLPEDIFVHNQIAENISFFNKTRKKNDDVLWIWSKFLKWKKRKKRKNEFA